MLVHRLRQTPSQIFDKGLINVPAPTRACEVQLCQRQIDAGTFLFPLPHVRDLHREGPETPEGVVRDVAPGNEAGGTRRWRWREGNANED